MLFRKKIDRYCTYCQFAGKIDDETMVCQFCGIVPSNHRCRRFRYDPLRRIPGRPAAPKHTHDDADFPCNPASGRKQRLFGNLRRIRTQFPISL